MNVISPLYFSYQNGYFFEREVYAWIKSNGTKGNNIVSLLSTDVISAPRTVPDT